MPYGLGIDLGTSCTVAAIIRAADGSTGPEVVVLGIDAPGLPTLLHLADDGTTLVGSAAEPLVISDPDRVFHGFLSHVGEQSSADPERNPAALTARLVRWVVDAVSNQEGGPPDQITLAHPAVWGPGECRAVQAALNEFGLRSVVLVSAALTAATTYAAQCHVRTGDVIAVYDLGATFSASVLRRESTGFTLLAKPQVIEDGGGGRFDEAILARVLHELGDQVAAPDLDDEAVLAGMAQLLAACVAAREALSSQLDVTIPVALPDLQTEVRLTRDELETLIAAPLHATVTTLRAAITIAQLTPSVISTVVVTGGCAGMPQVARLLTADLSRPVAVLTDPELAAARGAARLAAQSNTPAQVTAQPPPIAQQLPVAPPTTPAMARPSQAGPDEEPTEQFPAVHGFAGTSAGPFPTVREHRPSTGPRPLPRPSTLLAVAAGLLAATAVALPLTLLQASDSGAESSTPNGSHGGPTQSTPGPQPGGRPGTGTTGVGPADIPTSPPPPPTVQRIKPPLAPRPPLRPAPGRPGGTTNPTTVTTSPPSGTGTPPPSTTTSPPPTTTQPPPTTTTQPPPTTTTQPPPTTTTQPPPTTTPIQPPPTANAGS